VYIDIKIPQHNNDKTKMNRDTIIERRGFMVCLSSPSGAGKTSICNRVKEMDSNLNVSISVTTRKKRPGEEEARDYFFIDREQFDQLVKSGELLEHATVYGNGYGTPKQYVFETLRKGGDVIFDIDWQGTQQLAQIARADLVSIFILPPSTDELEQRLRKRAQDGNGVIEKRMQGAANEMSHWAEYDYVIVNYDLEKSVKEVQAIITAERLRRTRQNGLVNFVNKLRNIT
jgi:guanylate kinase